MSKLGDNIKSADWKSEKHVPVIECADRADAEGMLDVSISIGKEIAHPNTTEHHIRWIQLYFKPEGAGAVYEVGNYEFSAHGESAEGANAGPVFTHHSITTSLKINKPGTLIAASLCNIHGLWESSKTVGVSS